MFHFIPSLDPDTGVTTWTLSGKLHEKYRDQFKRFIAVYNLQNAIVNIPELIVPLKPKKERICRYCSRKYPEVTFKRKAHIISELIGNRALVSDFECDSCNELFCAYENDLAYFLGFTRTVLQTKTKTGTPTYKSPDKSLIVREGVEPLIGMDAKVIFESHKRRNKNFKFDPKSKTLTIKGTKHSYRPFNVYKILLKMALAALPEEEVDLYKYLLDLIRNKMTVDGIGRLMFRVNYTFIPGFAFPSPMLAIFKKKDPTSNHPTHVAYLCFMNSIFQFFLPTYEDDKWMYDGVQKIEIIPLPPLISADLINVFGFPQSAPLDLSSEDILRGEKIEMVFQFDNYRKLMKKKNLWFLKRKPKRSRGLLIKTNNQTNNRKK